MSSQPQRQQITPQLRQWIVEQAQAGAMPAGAWEIYYVTQSAPTAVLRRAYETRQAGIQTVIDALTGEELLRRDRRTR